MAENEAVRRKILVVDDEPDVRKLVSAMVTSRGFNALTADSGQHAIALFRQHQPFDYC
ncbi:MAG: response regulator [Acidobacteria bacterium]|nr:response regulator [Acidobacteriota bacterium]